MVLHNAIIMIKGEDKTKQIRSMEFVGPKAKIVFTNDPKPYLYHRRNIQVIKSALSDKSVNKGFLYLKEIAKFVGIRAEDGTNILEQHYNRIDFIPENSCLTAYLSGTYDKSIKPLPLTIFPFGFNSSQKKAVETAFKHTISVIQGPPGTGKTQTILNILANAVMRGETVAVVSNNNTATANIQEKLQKYGIDFVSAYLGNSQNKQDFIKEQKIQPLPDALTKWKLAPQKDSEIWQKMPSLITQITTILNTKNNLANLQQEKRVLHTEYLHFCEYYNKLTDKISLTIGQGLTSSELLVLSLKYEQYCEKTDYPSFWKKVYLWFKYGLRFAEMKSYPAHSVIDAIQKRYYQIRENELNSETDLKQKILDKFDFERKMREYTLLSLKLLKSKLSLKYARRQRQIYNLDELWKNSQQFLQDYPIILSTTYSLRSSLSQRVMYDYVIIDESSQVDLITGALALSCAKNAVIVGDSKQLPNVVKADTQKETDNIFKYYAMPNPYRYSNHSFLESILELFPFIPQTMLREHYRCHPKIIGFCNEKFYNGQLIILSHERNSRAPLILYKTVPGNHARGHLNQRQIDVIKQEVLPQEDLLNTQESVGIVTPYRQQSNALKLAFQGTRIQADTVDKFQGREKDVIILTTVDNQISEFTDQPNRLNVAISRAKNQLIVVTNGNDDNREGGLQDLIKYIEYNNFKTNQSHVQSVFDYLYHQYEALRQQMLKNKRVSAYDSENLIHQLILGILKLEEFSSLQVALHMPLRRLIKNFSALTSDEKKYVSHPNTHIDFLIFNRMDKIPQLVIEVDGAQHHKEGSKQYQRDQLKNHILYKYRIPLLRLKTTGSGEKLKIISALRNSL
ncbi:MAG TPA: DNA helicase [Elusimicrobia bacterium]|nr:DNA helicase [Elusimicrobiota bacterium]